MMIEFNIFEYLVCCGGLAIFASIIAAFSWAEHEIQVERFNNKLNKRH